MTKSLRQILNTNCIHASIKKPNRRINELSLDTLNSYKSKADAKYWILPYHHIKKDKLARGLSRANLKINKIKEARLKRMGVKTVSYDDNYKNTEQEKLDIFPIHEKLKEHYKFDPQRDEGTQEYTGTHSYSINNHLWQQHTGLTQEGRPAKHELAYSPEEEEKTNKRIESMDKTLDAHRTPHSLTVYSGLSSDPREKKNVNGIVHHPAFLSTSLRRRIAEGRAPTTTTSEGSRSNVFTVSHKHILKIDIPKDHPGAYVDHFSENPGEHEFILPRGLNLKHIKTETEKTHFKETAPNAYLETHCHHMKIV